jgi:hypothetical protein
LVGDARSIDASAWGAWARAGADRWDVLGRSWTTFARNTTELIDLLNRAADLTLALTLMNDDRQADGFWPELDQRLHNQLASMGTLIDHSRRLIKYYRPDAPTLAAEYEAHKASVIATDEAAFLGDLRNYLLHYSLPAVVQTLTMGAGTARHAIKLSSPRLLEWDNWSPQAHAYLSGFGPRDGPVLGADIAAYSNAMRGFYTWLFDQRPVVRSMNNAPARFRIDTPAT